MRSLAVIVLLGGCTARPSDGAAGTAANRLSDPGSASAAPVLDVTAFGAAGDGVTDDTDPIAAAVARAEDDDRYGGLGLVTASDVAVRRGTFSHNGTTRPEDGYGIACASSGYGPSRRITIDGVSAIGDLRKGIDVHSARAIAITNNFVWGF